MIICLVCLLFLNSTIPYVSAINSSYFARIVAEDVYLYKTPLDVQDYSNIYFTLPKTYFVELISVANSQFYHCNYLSFSGYVKKNSVQAVSGTPSNPYLKNINFRVYSDLSRDMRTAPTNSAESSQVCFVPQLSRNLTYYGTIKGKSLIDGRTDIWYYCKYSGDQDYFGYVYSDFCDEMTPIISNTENLTEISNPTFEPSSITPTSMPLKDNHLGIIIGLLSVPALIFVFMVFKGKNIISRDKTISKEIRDY